MGSRQLHLFAWGSAAGRGAPPDLLPGLAGGVRPAAAETRPPAEYLRKTYYEIWLAGLERLLIERGLVGCDEMAAGRALQGPRPVRRILAAADVPAVLSHGGSTDREAPRKALFSSGDRV